MNLKNYSNGFIRYLVSLKGFLDVFVIGLVGFLTVLAVFFITPARYEILAIHILAFIIGTRIGPIFSRESRQKNPIMWWAYSITPFLALAIASYAKGSLDEQLLAVALLVMGGLIGWWGRNGSREDFEAELQKNRTQKPHPMIIRMIIILPSIMLLLMIFFIVGLTMALGYPTYIVANYIVKRRTQEALYDAGMRTMGLR